MKILYLFSSLYTDTIASSGDTKTPEDPEASRCHGNCHRRGFWRSRCHKGGGCKEGDAGPTYNIHIYSEEGAPNHATHVPPENIRRMIFGMMTSGGDVAEIHEEFRKLHKEGEQRDEGGNKRLFPDKMATHPHGDGSAPLDVMSQHQTKMEAHGMKGANINIYFEGRPHHHPHHYHHHRRFGCGKDGNYGMFGGIKYPNHNVVEPW